MEEAPKPRKRRGCLIAGMVAFLFIVVVIAVPGFLTGSRASNCAISRRALSTTGRKSPADCALISNAIAD